MYLLEFNKYGLKEYYSSITMSKAYEQIIKKVNELELGINTNQFRTYRTFQNYLRPIKLNEKLELQFENTIVTIIKTKKL